MARYEFKDGKSAKFWEITLDGDSFVVRFGRIGASGTEQTKVFADAAKAQKEHDKLVAKKTKKGYALVESEAAPAAPKDEGAPELEAAIAANLDDAEAWSVYADWLQQKGDKRGEYISLSLSGAPEADREALLKANAKAWHGAALHKHLEDEDLGECLDVDWHHGFIRRVKVGTDWDAEANVVELLGAVLRSPAARFLETVEVGLADAEGENDYGQVIVALGRVGKLSALKRLHIGAYEYPDETEISWTTVGNISKLYPVLPNLRALQLTGGEIGLGKVALPKLESLFLETGGLPKSAAASVAKASLPELTTLELWLGAEDYGADSDVATLKPLFAAKGFPKLKTLGLKNGEFMDDIVQALIGSPLLAQVERLDLSMGTMRDRGAQLIIDNAPHFAHLKSLSLEDNCFDDALGERIKALLTGVEVNVEDQEPPDEDDWAYVSVGE